MLSFNHPRHSPFIRLVQFTPNDLDTGAVKPFLRQLAEMELTEAEMSQGICAEISPRSQLPSPWSLHQRIDRALPTHASHAREHCHIKAINGPWSVGRFWLFRNHCKQSLPTWEKLPLATCLRISRFMREERYPTILLLEAPKTVERHHVFQHSDYNSEDLFMMTTSTISLVHIATTSTTVVPNSFLIRGQVIILDP
ncbi:hypothetical protein BKA70DRAFT_1562860 [Coprinopsis sp. MPI-PUGE-AT-0042]|nr:hypothetical protein BKA70DRAFT_1562860 [Coprinopsis sp. MPI-PUGE-AT-0042]